MAPCSEFLTAEALQRVGLILDAIEQLARTCDCGSTAYIESFIAEARVNLARVAEVAAAE